MDDVTKDRSGIRACGIYGRPKSNQEANEIKLKLLERRTDELMNMIVILQERIISLEKNVFPSEK
jgi:hypothetical protein